MHVETEDGTCSMCTVSEIKLQGQGPGAQPIANSFATCWHPMQTA